MKRTAALVSLLIFLAPALVFALAIGDRVQTTSNLNVRTSALPSATLLGKIPLGSQGSIIAGPITNSYTWWQVKWDSGLSGWSVQNYFQISTASGAQVPGAALRTTPRFRNAQCAAAPVALPIGKACNGKWKEVKAINGCTASWQCVTK